LKFSRIDYPKNQRIPEITSLADRRGEGLLALRDPTVAKGRVPAAGPVLFGRPAVEEDR
jgi:hypothetical protein